MILFGGAPRNGCFNVMMNKVDVTVAQSITCNSLQLNSCKPPAIGTVELRSILHYRNTMYLGQQNMQYLIFPGQHGLKGALLRGL